MKVTFDATLLMASEAFGAIPRQEYAKRVAQASEP